MGEGLQTLALLFVQQPSIPPSVFASSKSRWSNAVKMLRYALSACAILALAPTVASAADFGPYGPGDYVEQRPLPPPPAYYPQPYYGRPYYDDAYYAPRFRRPYPYYVAYPYWRGPRFAYYGPGRYWGGHWGGRGRRW
jgi:hypothetical protein